MLTSRWTRLPWMCGAMRAGLRQTMTAKHCLPGVAGSHGVAGPARPVAKMEGKADMSTSSQDLHPQDAVSPRRVLGPATVYVFQPGDRERTGCRRVAVEQW